MDHLRDRWSRLSWVEPNTIRGWPLPQGGQFARPKPNLDPDIFDSSEVMHPWIRDTVLNQIAGVWNKYGDWWSHSRVYLAGSLASYWWGTPDFDVLVGIEPRWWDKNQEGTHEEICKRLTDEFRVTINSEAFTFPAGPDGSRLTTEETFYVNADSYDIRNLKPYAAYELLSNTWYVHPSHMDKHWGPKMLPWAFWEHAANLADEGESVLDHGDVAGAADLYDRLHSARNEAFSSRGMGLSDPRALLWVVMVRWGILGRLEMLIHPDRPPGHLPPAVAKRG